MMTTMQQSEIFFFISSLGFISVWLLIVVLLIYALRTLSSFSKILGKAEKDIDALGDITKEMLEDIRKSSVYQFLFRRKRK